LESQVFPEMTLTIVLTSSTPPPLLHVVYPGLRLRGIDKSLVFSGADLQLLSFFLEADRGVRVSPSNSFGLLLCILLLFVFCRPVYPLNFCLVTLQRLTAVELEPECDLSCRRALRGGGHSSPYLLLVVSSTRLRGQSEVFWTEKRV